MELPRVDHYSLAIDEEGVVVKGHDILEQFSPLWVEKRAGSSAKQGTAALGGKRSEGEDIGEPHAEGKKTGKYPSGAISLSLGVVGGGGGRRRDCPLLSRIDDQHPVAGATDKS